MDTFPAPVQRPALLALIQAMDAASTTLKRDECSDWMLKGTNGRVYGVPGGYQLLIGADSPRGWSAMKRRLLTMCDLQCESDDGGSMFLRRLPASEHEAETLRRDIGIRKTCRQPAPSLVPEAADFLLAPIDSRVPA